MKIYENSCRVCLVNTESKDKDEKWISIEETDLDDLAISDKISICTGIIINREILLAKSICKHCIERLRSAFDFQKTCKQSDNILQSYMKNNRTTPTKFKQENMELNSLPSNDESSFYPEVKVEMNSSSDSDKNSEYINDDLSFNDSELAKHKSKLKKKTISYLRNNDNDSHKTTDKRRRCNRSVNNDIQEESLENCRIYNTNVEPVKEVEKQKNAKKNEKESFICELCGKVYKKRKRADHMRWHSGEKKFQSFVCELCGNVYKKKPLLADHMRWHSNENEFQCKICEKSFLLGIYLTRHMKIHSGIRDFHCNFCSRTFYTNGLKRAHEKVHTGEAQYPCKLCDRSFSYSQSLQRHMMIHSGVKPFKCKDCGKEFRQQTHLKQHLCQNINKAKTASAL